MLLLLYYRYYYCATDHDGWAFFKWRLKCLEYCPSLDFEFGFLIRPGCTGSAFKIVLSGKTNF